MGEKPFWMTPKHPTSELDRKRIELRIVEMQKNRALKRTFGIGKIRVQPHHATSGLVCIWVMFDEPPRELAIDEIDEERIIPHPIPSVADYLCEAQYLSGE